MTNDAPERIWAVDGLTEVLSFNVYDNGGTEYIRADQAQAEQEAAVVSAANAAMAAAYEDAARLVETFGITRDEFEFHNGNPRPSLAKAIRARADSDTLATRDAQVRAEALREAAIEAEEVAQARLGDERDTARACRDHILALTPADQEEDG